MVYAIARHIITPLGDCVSDNLKAVLSHCTAIARHDHIRMEKLTKPAMVSLFEQLPNIEEYTFFESLCIRAVQESIQGKDIDLRSNRCVFILSTTKGEIWTPLPVTAQHIASYFDNLSTPIVVSNACTSGVSAQLCAFRLIESGMYDTAIIIGCELQSEFIVSGFQSFHALSELVCRPFDSHRDGLNVGEAASVLVLSNQSKKSEPVWQLMGGSIHNDANHISGPSRTGEGSWRCLNEALSLISKEELACVSVHGTGTLYNDEMESIALHRAGLEDIPISALKGYYGHTMGAAGVLETVLSMAALEQGIILPAYDYSEQGTTYAVNLSNQTRTTDKRTFIKLLSGFGGVNAAVGWKKQYPTTTSIATVPPPVWEKLAEVELTEKDDINALYRDRIGTYPKYFKMDRLSRLGFVATELLLQKIRERQPNFTLDHEHCAVLLANRSSCIDNDRAYQKTIAAPTDYFPSPALFVYTLPNIVTGEISIRQHLNGETAFYILNEEKDMDSIVQATSLHTVCRQMIVGWIEYADDTDYYAHVKLLEKR